MCSNSIVDSIAKFVPTAHRRLHTIFDYRSDVIACVDSCEHSLYTDISQARLLLFPLESNVSIYHGASNGVVSRRTLTPTIGNILTESTLASTIENTLTSTIEKSSLSIQEKRRQIQLYCRGHGIDEILMLDDDVLITDAQITSLVEFCREHSLAFGSFSNRTALQKPFRTTPCLYLRVDLVPLFRTEEVFEDMCLEFECLRQGIRVGCLKGQLQYLNNVSTIVDRSERVRNTVQLYPEFTSIQQMETDCNSFSRTLTETKNENRSQLTFIFARRAQARK